MVPQFVESVALGDAHLVGGTAEDGRETVTSYRCSSIVGEDQPTQLPTTPRYWLGRELENHPGIIDLRALAAQLPSAWRFFEAAVPSAKTRRRR